LYAIGKSCTEEENMKKFEFWTTAYRLHKDDSTLLDNADSPYTVIPNTWRYWAADPHLFEYKGKTYVFAELYDRVLRQGVIGCCELTEKGASRWKVVLKMPFHLSYPHIFRKDGYIYMIPESYVNEEIALYQAVDFPNKWERVRPVKENCIAVDTTLIPWDGKTWLLTQDEENGLTLVTEDGDQSWSICKDDPMTRPAGPVFFHKGKLLRPSQNCAGGYGRAVRFHEILEVNDGIYREKFLCEIRPEQITSDLKFPAQGIHTYGQTDCYEVIDLKGYEVDPLFYVMRPIWFIWRRVKKLFARR
jgi:hypothetical protein